MTGWSELFLGVIAAATLLMAFVQIGVVIVATRIARQAQQTLTSVHQEIRPLVARVSAVADEASRTAALASAQVQKIDRLITDLADRVDETSAIVQNAIVTPAREGVAIFAAIKAVLAGLRGLGNLGRGASRSEEEDPLFIG